MKNPLLSFPHLLRPKTALTTVVALAVIVTVVELTSAPVGSQVHWNNIAGTPALAQQQNRDEVRIELTSNGFAPNELQHAPGTFAIAIENNALSGEYRLKLRAEDGTLLNEYQVQKGSSAWTVSLQTGRYTLTETNHPQWICSITIQ